MDKETKALLNKLNEKNKKEFDRDTVFLASEMLDGGCERISSGSVNLDFALGGGFPRGRIVELFGPEGGGKTTVLLMMIAEAQKDFPDKFCAFIDVEHTFDRDLAESYGVNLEDLAVVEPENAENALDMAEAFIMSEKFVVVGIDSVAALLPIQEQQGSMADQQMGLQARLLGKACRKLAGPCAANNVCLVFINQLREKVGVMYGNPETTPGGRALKFYSSIRVRVSAGEPIKDRDEQIGHVVNCKCAKNKTARPFRTASFKLIYGEGLDKVDEVTELAVAAGFIKKAGGWFSVPDPDTGEPIKKVVGDTTTVLRWQGQDKVVAYLKTDEELYQYMLERLRGNDPE